MTQQDIATLQLLAAAEREKERQEAETFLSFLGRLAGATGRGALGVGRFIEEGFQPVANAFTSPVTDNPEAVRRILSDPSVNQAVSGAQALGDTGAGALAESIAPAVSGETLGVGPNAFDSFVQNLARQRQDQSIIDALTLQASRDAYRQTQFNPAQRLALEAVGDPTNLIPGAALARGLRLAGRAAPRAAGEGIQSIVQTGARQVPNALERGTLRAGTTAERLTQRNAQLATRELAETGQREAAQRAGQLRQVRQQAVTEQFGAPPQRVSTETALRAVERPVPSGGANDITPDDLRSVQDSIGRHLSLAEIDNLAPDVAREYRDIRARQIARQRFETQEAVNRLAFQLEEAQPLSPGEIESLRHTERQKRVAAGASQLESHQGTEAFGRAAAQLRGELPNPQFQAPTLTAREVFLMTEHIRNMPNTRFFTKLNTQDALNKLLLGESPTVSELVLLEKAFGRKLVEAFLRRPRGARRAVSIITDLLQVPKTLRSAFDLSAPLRQGLLLGPRNPREFATAFKAMFESFSPQKAFEINSEIYADPDIQSLIDNGLFLHNVEGAGPAALQLREEAFISRYASKIPGVRLSERTYGTFLNKLRADVAKKSINQWRREGLLPEQALSQADLTAEQIQRLQSLSRFINVFTGRGSVPERAQGIADVLNILFWSPRLTISRFEAPTLLADPLIRRQAAENLAATFGLGMTVLAIVEASAPGRQVETDPRSSDFGKIRLGSTRLDFWGGFQQVARYMAQIATNQTRTTDTRELITPFGVSRSDRIFRFGRSKLSPGVSALLANELFGESFLGDELGEEPERGALPSSPVPIQQGLEAATLESTREQEAIQQLTPLFGLDVVNAMEEQGIIRGTGLALPSLFGVGTQTFNPDEDEQQSSRSNSGIQVVPVAPGIDF